MSLCLISINPVASANPRSLASISGGQCCRCSHIRKCYLFVYGFVLSVCVCACVCVQGRQRVVRRDSVVKVELAELSAELDLDVLSRLGSLSRAFSHCPTQNPQPAATQVLALTHTHTGVHTHTFLLRSNFWKAQLVPFTKCVCKWIWLLQFSCKVVSKLLLVGAIFIYSVMFILCAPYHEGAVLGVAEVKCSQPCRSFNPRKWRNRCC